MTKRALIVIAVIILIPIIVIMHSVSRFKDSNNVVAEYGGNIDIIEYDGMTLYRVKSEFEYKFRFGEYLGKIGNSLTGAPFYLVADDETEGYYAIAEGEKKILYTRTGKLIDGVRTSDSVATRLIFDDFYIVEEDVDKISAIVDLSGKTVSADMSKYDSFKYYDIYLAFDSSAVITEYFGRLFYLTERGDWLYVSPEALESAEEEYGDDISECVYLADLISDKALKEQLNSYFAAPADESSAEVTE